MLYEELYCTLTLLKLFAKREAVDDWEEIRCIEFSPEDLQDWRENKHKAYRYAHDLYTDFRFNFIYKAKNLPQNTKTTFYNLFNTVRHMNAIYESEEFAKNHPR